MVGSQFNCSRDLQANRSSAIGWNFYATVVHTQIQKMSTLKYNSSPHSNTKAVHTQIQRLSTHKYKSSPHTNTKVLHIQIQKFSTHKYKSCPHTNTKVVLTQIQKTYFFSEFLRTGALWPRFVVAHIVDCKLDPTLVY